MATYLMLHSPRNGPASGTGRGYFAECFASLTKPWRNVIEGYLAAHRNFAQAKRNIEAIDQGFTAAIRGRTENTTPAFGALTPEGQQAFRASYVDSLIEAALGGADV